MKTKITQFPRLIAILTVWLAMLFIANNVYADNSPLCFTAKGGSVTVCFEIKNATHTIQYSTNGISWSNYTSNTDVTINANKSVYFRAASNQTSAQSFGGSSHTSSTSRFYFSSPDNGKVDASGNIMSLYGPDCPDLQLHSYAFQGLFQNCKLLLSAPILPSTKLNKYCYNSMFYGCSALKTAPALPATTLADCCYYQMFYGCSSLKKTPLLPATTLTTCCYYLMFYNCKSLNTIETIPATVLADNCCDHMFYNCQSLIINTNGPGKQWKIPATTSAKEALKGMFTGTGGTMNGTPSLNVTYYVASTMYNVQATCNDKNKGSVTGSGQYVYGDTAILVATPKSNAHFVKWSNGSTSKTIRVIVTKDTTLTAFFDYDEFSVTATSNNNERGYVEGNVGIHQYGDTINLVAIARDGYIFDSWSNGSKKDTLGFVVTSDTILTANFYSSDYLCLTAVDGPAAITININGISSLFSLLSSVKTSLNSRKNWNSNRDATTINLNEGDSLFIKYGNMSSRSETNYVNFQMTGKVAASGNVMSLIDEKLEKTTAPKYAFYKLFENCTNLISAPKLPAIALSTSCYERMFANCTDLTESPEILARTVATRSCYEMFNGCYSLTTLPDLYSTTLADSCYYRMFAGCDSLVINTDAPGYAWQIPSNTITAQLWNEQMFAGTSGTFTGNPQTGVKYFVYKPVNYTLSVVSNNEEWGSVMGGGSFLYGDSVEIKAIPAANCYFKGWSNGTLDSVTKVVVTKDMQLVANFQKITYDVSPTCQNTNNGIVNGYGTYYIGDSATLTAIPAPECKFLCWSDGTTDSIIHLYVDDNILIDAIFIPNTEPFVEPISLPYCYQENSNLYLIDTLGVSVINKEDLTFTLSSKPIYVVLPLVDPYDPAYLSSDWKLFIEANTNGVSLLSSRDINIGLLESLYDLTSFESIKTIEITNNVSSEVVDIPASRHHGCKFVALQLPGRSALLASKIKISTLCAERKYECGVGTPIVSVTNNVAEISNSEQNISEYPRQADDEENMMSWTNINGEWYVLNVDDQLIGNDITEYTKSYSVYLPKANCSNSIYAVRNGKSARNGFNSGLNCDGMRVCTITNVTDDTYISIPFTIQGYGKTAILSTSIENPSGGGIYNFRNTQRKYARISIPVPQHYDMKNYIVPVEFGNVKIGSKAYIDIPLERLFTSFKTESGLQIESAVGNPSSIFSIGTAGYSSVVELVPANTVYSPYNDLSANTNLIQYPSGAYALRINFNPIESQSYNASFYLKDASNTIAVINVTGEGVEVVDTNKIKIPAQELWDIQYKKSGDASWINDRDYGYINYEIKNLEPNTYYVARIRNHCSSGYSDWSKEIFFKTGDSIYYVAAKANNVSMGNVTGSGSYFYGDTAMLTATANKGYHFVNWSDGNTDNPRQIVVTQDTLFTAIFDTEESAIDYLCVKTKRPNNTVQLNEVFETSISSSTQSPAVVTSPYSYDLEYSLDGNTWTTYTIGRTISLSNIGDSVMFRGNNISISRSDSAYCQFQFGDTVEVSGNIMTLVDKTGKSTTIPNDYCFAYLFKNCSTMVSAPRLPATNLKDYCYEGLFQTCSGLTTAPILPATTMAIRCYRYMFMDCSSLETAPSLPARNLAMECYSNMFRCCSTLTIAPVLPATNLAYSSYNGMFYNCTSLTKAPALPATTLSDRSYCWMFYGCSSLKEAPILPATTMTEDCYYRMFQGCSALVVIPPLPATILAEYCYYSMFQGCTSLTTLPSLPATTLANACCYHMFDGCTSLIVNESGAGKQWKIPATTIAGLTNPLKGMFAGTSGTMNGTPSVNTTYYVASDTTCIPLCFTASNGNITVRFEIKNVTHTIQYSTNGTSWSNYTSNSDVTINANQSIYFRAASNQTTAKAFGSGEQMQYTGSRFYFTSSNDGAVEASGNIMSLYGPDCPNLSLPSKAFAGMFSNCDLLTTSPLLPATYLGADCYNSMFYMCTSLVKAPDLPAMTMASTCYENMFRGCTSLQKAPELPALNLAYGCYDNMFYDCTSLTIAPELPATTLPYFCYASMFFNCYSLKEPPVLPVISLSAACCVYMFKNCTSMVINKVGPGKPWKITTSSGSGNSGLSQMFTGTSGTMNGTPSVNTTYYIASSSDYYTVTVNINDSTMGNVTGSGSYSYGDTAIVTAIPNPHCRFVNWSNGMTTPTIHIRVLGDTILTANFVANPTCIFPETHIMCQGETYNWHNKSLTASGVYYDSLQTTLGCDSVYELTLTVNPKYLIEDTIYALNFPYQWHGRDIVSSGVYYDSLTTEGSGCDSIYKLTVIDSPKPLCFTAKGGSVTVRFDIKNVTHTIQYSTDGTSWSNYTSNTNVTLSANQSIYFRAASNQTIATAFSTYGDSSNSRFYFSSTDGGMVEASGNIMSLYGPDCPNLQLQQYAFYKMFSECSLLTTAPSLSATNLAYRCYDEMFNNCTSLTIAPSLPATNLAEKCYASMFSSCTSLTIAPSLPATNLASTCYANMFSNCISLTTAPSLPATNLAVHCYMGMFFGCHSLTTAPSLPATNLAYGCYFMMFWGCNSLTTAPSLPATNLADHCYFMMFYGCNSLTIASSLPATNLAESCYENMFSNCTSLTTAPSLPATNLADRCYLMMFSNCTSLTTAPSLPATNLAKECYYTMFSGCRSLTTAPSLPATNLADHCYYRMFGSCRSLTTTPSLPATNLANHCYEEMFSGCTSLIVNTTGPGKQWKIPATTIDGLDNPLTDMFTGTSGTMNGTPSVNTTYYLTSGNYSVTVNVNDPAMGSAFGNGLYKHGDTAILIASANPNYHFVRWSNGMISPTISLEIFGDTSLTAIFEANQTYFIPETHTICQGETYNWHNKSLTASGIYYDSLKTQYGSDSVYQLTLTVNPTYLIQETYSICQGETYSWRTRNLSTAGVYYDSLKTTVGCDSIYKLTLKVNSTYLIQQTVKWPSSKGSYIWRGKNITSSGVYYDSLKTMSYCDSVYELTIQFADDYLFTENASICPGDQYSWRGHYYREAGVYYDSLRTVDGILDSVYKLTLTVNPTYFIQETYSICQGETYTWRERNLTTSGVYYDSLQTVAGCDSVYELTLTVNLTYFIPETYSICQGETYSWRNKSLTNAGVYYDSLLTVAGCDSVYELTLTVNPTYLIQETYSICQGETYTWRTRNLTTSGVYYDSLTTLAGCDSVYELTLTVNPTYLIQETYSICQGETYSWRTMNLTTSGVYYDSLQTVAGCDSVYELTLTVNPTYLIQETHAICQGETYSWRTKNLTTTGVYYDSLTTLAGCDSVYELTLTVNPTYLFQEAYSICQGETYTWRTKNLSTTGVYYDSLLTVAGCDSVYELTLIVNPTCLFQETYSICQGETYSWRNKSLTTSGVYYDSLQTVAGCDSVYELTLTVNPTYLIQETYSICQGETYSWRTRNLSTTGVYYDSLQTVAGCDSVYELTLTVNPTYLFQGTHSICQGETYSWRTRNLTTSGVYYDSLQTVAGCDSVYELTLTVNPTYLIQETYSICQGETYTWRTRNMTTSGVYYDSLTTLAGCDSVYELTLTVNPTYLIQETYSICQGETYTWRERNLTTSGVYYDSLTTLAGCDSVYELTLTVNPTYLIQETYSICQGETYTWRSKNLTTAGIYYDSLQTTVGCDSVYELTLTVNPTYLIQETYSICQGETYTWRSKNLSTAGVYYDSLQTIAGCDSVYELTLTVNPTYLFQETYTICQGETYSWRTRNLSTAGVYYDSLQTMAGCDSVYELTLTVNPTYLIQETYSICQGETYTWRTRSLTASGVSYDSLQTVAGCDSVYELTLTVNPTYLIQETHAICQGETYTWRTKNLTTSGVYYDSLQTVASCDSVYELTLTVNPTYFIQESDVICHGDVYNWHSKKITNAGIYYDSLKTMTGCDSVYELTLTINNYNVSVNVNDANGGKAYLYIENAEIPSAVVECGETVELHAETFADYHFVEWSDGNTDSIRNVEVVSDTSLVAMFEPNCGEWANWPVAFKYNSLLILNVDSIYSMGYYPTPEDVAWYKVIGDPDNLDDIFPADDQYICNGHYMSLITNDLSYGQYYAVVDVSKNAGVLCHDKMRTEIVEYAYNDKKTHIELAPTNVKNGDAMTVFGLVPEEETTLMVYDYSGKLIETVRSNGSDKCQITAVGSVGVYVVNVTSDSVSETLKFIVTK